VLCMDYFNNSQLCAGLAKIFALLVAITHTVRARHGCPLLGMFVRICPLSLSHWAFIKNSRVQLS